MNRDTILPNALTTLQRVKDRIFDTNSQFNFPGDITLNSATIANVTVPTSLTVGQAIYGAGIPFGAYVTVKGTNSLTISAVATATTATLAITVLNQPTGFDNVLIRMINSATKWVEKETGGRQFTQKLYPNEVYSSVSAQQRHLITKQIPVTCIVTSGTMTANSKVVTAIPSTAGMKAGMIIVNSSNLPAPQIITIVSVDSITQITLSAAAQANMTSVYFQVNGLLSFQWRAGTPSAPSWTDFIPDQFELVQDGKAGIIRLYGIMPRLYDNMVRITYYAGYLIDWANAGNETTHTLPSDLTDTTENLIVRNFKRRQNAGKLSEAFEGATTSWDREIDATDTDVLGHYRMAPAFF